MIDRKSVDINVVKNKIIPWMPGICGIFCFITYKSNKKYHSVVANKN